jgi:flagellar hook-associated protein 3 FlgL
MRVSTSQFYSQSGLQMSKQQSDISEQVNYISSGKRVLTAKDDAVAYGTLAGYKNGLANIETYQRNITQAENHNNLIETSLANTEDIMLSLRDLMLQANNGVRTPEDLASLAQQANNSLNEMLAIANTQDEAGSYIFSGYQIDSAPFVLQTDNSVVYRGDNGVRELQIAKNVAIESNQGGQKVFEQVANALGDFSATYNTNTSGIELESAVIADRSSYDGSNAGTPPNYTFNFTSATDFTITDGAGNVTSVNNYISGQAIGDIPGMAVTFSGNPLPGDEIVLSPQQNVSIFASIQAAVDWISTKASVGDVPQTQIDFNHSLNQLDEVMNHLGARRADAGINLQVIERQKNTHLDTQLYLTTGRASIEDLDFAKAIANFEQSKVALQAAQQTFTQVQGLTLFNYIR